jgi:hypothetical protein
LYTSMILEVVGFEGSRHGALISICVTAIALGDYKYAKWKLQREMVEHINFV